MGDFEHDTRVQKTDNGYTAEISKDWEIWGPSGGYVASIALRAAGAAATIKRPVTFHGHYLRVARFDRVHLAVDVTHRGLRSESLRVRMLQDDKLIFEGALRTSAICEGLSYDELQEATARAPRGPHPASLSLINDAHDPNRDRMTFWKNFERRVENPDYFSAQHRSEQATTEGWCRYTSKGPFSDPFVDAARSLVILDTCLWPCVFRKYGPTDFVAPSLDITVMFHQGSPESEWLRHETRAHVAAGGLIAGEGHTFDEAGRTLATGFSQMLCVRRPAES